MKLAEFPNLLNAIILVYADNGMLNRNFSEEQLAQANLTLAGSLDPFTREHYQRADSDATNLAAAQLRDYIPEDLIDIDLADPTDNALETMVSGEATIVDLLVAWSFTSALHAVLASAFDGELHECLTRINKGGRKTAAGT